MVSRWLRLCRIALHAGRGERHDERRESSGYWQTRYKSNYIEDDCQLPTGDRASFRNGWGSRVHGCHTTWEGISPVPVAFSMCRNTDSAAVCACIRQETIVHLKSVLCLTPSTGTMCSRLLTIAYQVSSRLSLNGWFDRDWKWMGLNRSVELAKGALAENAQRRLGHSAARAPC